MNAADLLSELRPPLDDAPADETTLERILLAGPEPAPLPRRRYRRPLAIAVGTVIAATAGIASIPTGNSGPVGLAGAVAALAEPEVMLHYEVTTTHLPSGATETAETWQTPDGRRSRMIRGNGVEFAYDQRARMAETYAPERDEVFVDTEPSLFEDRPDAFGSIGSTAGSNPVAAGDLPALLTRALDGEDPNVRHIGRATIRGIDVDHIRIERDFQLADAPAGASPGQLRAAPMRTVTISRDVYVRHDNALPVRVVDHLDELGNPRNTTSISEFTDVQKLTLDASTEPALKLDRHPSAGRTVRGPFDDSAGE